MGAFRHAHPHGTAGFAERDTGTNSLSLSAALGKHASDSARAVVSQASSASFIAELLPLAYVIEVEGKPGAAADDNLQRVMNSARVRNALREDAMRSLLKRDFALSTGKSRGHSGKVGRPWGTIAETTAELGGELRQLIESAPEYRRVGQTLNDLKLGFDRAQPGMFANSDRSQIVVLGSVVVAGGQCLLFQGGPEHEHSGATKTLPSAVRTYGERPLLQAKTIGRLTPQGNDFAWQNLENDWRATRFADEQWLGGKRLPFKLAVNLAAAKIGVSATGHNVDELYSLGAARLNGAAALQGPAWFELLMRVSFRKQSGVLVGPGVQWQREPNRPDLNPTQFFGTRWQFGYDEGS